MLFGLFGLIGWGGGGLVGFVVLKQTLQDLEGLGLLDQPCWVQGVMDFWGLGFRV